MRSEHQTRGAEWDLGYWRHRLCYMARAGVAKRVKAQSHRIDRRNARVRLRGWSGE